MEALKPAKLFLWKPLLWSLISVMIENRYLHLLPKNFPGTPGQGPWGIGSGGHSQWHQIQGRKAFGWEEEKVVCGRASTSSERLNFVLK